MQQIQAVLQLQAAHTDTHNRLIYGQIPRHTHIHTDIERHMYRYRSRHIHTQVDTHTYTHKYTHIHTYTT